MPASKAVIGELRDWARRARAMADAEALAWLRGLKSRPPFERAIGLWAWSEALTASADSDAALSEIARWLREGDADDVRAAALVIVWRAGPALAPLAAPLAGRLSSNDTIDTRRWAAFALHGLVEAKAPIAPAFPALFQALEQDSERLWVLTFILSRAHSDGASFVALADGVARTLCIGNAPERIYSELLDSGFVPPAHHKQALFDLLDRSSKRDTAVKGLRALRAAGHDFEDFVPGVVKRLGAKSAKEVQSALGVAGGLVAAGVPLARFFAALEKALNHKTAAAKHAAYGMLTSDAMDLPEEARARERHAAEAAGFARLAEILRQPVPPKRTPRPPDPAPAPPPLDVDEMSRQLRSDALVDVRTALWRTKRARGAELAQLLPGLVDALATEERVLALEQLRRALEEGHDLAFAMPVVAGLLLDRDFYDQMSLAEVLRFLLAALERGHDITMAWPWVPAFLDGARCDELRVRLAEKGLRAGLDVRPWDQWLGRWFVDVVLTGHPSGVHDAIRFMGLAAECLLVAYGKDMRS